MHGEPVKNGQRDIHHACYSCFIRVEVHIDGKRVARNGTVVRADVYKCWRDVSGTIIEEHAQANSPLPGNCRVILMCTKMSDTVKGRSTADVGLDKDCSAFLDFLLLIAMTSVPAKRFIIKCYRPLEDRRPRMDVIGVMMATQSTGNFQLPHARAWSVRTSRDILYIDLRQYIHDQGAVFPSDLCLSLGDKILKHLTSSLFSSSLKVWKALDN
jgi:hypothetical protein